MAKSVAGNRAYYSLDDLEIFDDAALDPVNFIGRLSGPVTIDEVQRVPRLLLPIKMTVDDDPTFGRFLLTGSANLLTLPKIADSLAGRMQIIELFPLAQAEIEGTKVNAVDRLFSQDPQWKSLPSSLGDISRRIVAGGYPEPLKLPAGRPRANWFRNYVQTILQRDIVEIAKIEHVVGMRQLLQIVAARTGRILNLTALSNDIALKARTAQRYFEILEHIFLLFRIPAWTFERGRRYIHSPKVYINDTGLAAALTNYDETTLLADRSQFGFFLESFVATELRKHASWSDIQTSLFHYRLESGKEIDLLFERPSGERVGVEIKSAATIDRRDVATFVTLAQNLKLQSGIVFYTGTSVVPIGENITAVPIANLWTP